ncbi:MULTISPECIES: 2OG-Fe(II) oxygenase [Microbulbifer]|uniref:2OG-Fe(II) oxygenase n=1 Tax=Microbulbifer celer TaxID=435905 RepID=A0ABW3U9C3_9GAMM|nr:MULTISPECIES: 2OG-Fe(II) oxygenase [Microbulbifer]UFN56582.1 2OG-Fe(II) oxygenase [Microbulbifer celer]
MNAVISAADIPRGRGPDDDDPLERIATALRETGYIVLPAPLPPALLGALLRHFRSLDQSRFQTAGIGREDDHQLNQFVRTDEIYWLDRSNPAVSAYLDSMETLRLGLNRRLFLGLFDYECHYAHYQRGSFYKKHLDAFKGSTNRVVSTVLYLTPNWQPRDGGELQIYAPIGGDTDEGMSHRVIEKVAPRFGQMVIFLSEEFPHEVLTSHRSRYSVTGWFRVNNSLGEQLDPPR